MTRNELRPGLVAALLFALIAAGAGICSAQAEVKVRDLTRALFEADRSRPLDLSNQNFSFLDLSGLDFKRAKLTRTNLYGANLAGANLSGSDLSNAVLDRATITGTDFSGANLKEALIRLPHAVSSSDFNNREAPKFFAADLSSARLVLRLDGADFRRANLTGARILTYYDSTQNAAASRSSLRGCNFAEANLTSADFKGANLAFANFENANLTRAVLENTDLTQANLRGANVTEARFRGANLKGAKLTGYIGGESVSGLDQTAGTP